MDQNLINPSSSAGAVSFLPAAFIAVKLDLPACHSSFVTLISTDHRVQMLSPLILSATLAIQAFAGPLELWSPPAHALVRRDTGAITSFVALGESYATGVGAGVADRSVLLSRCLRYNQAYPRVLARDGGMPGPSDETRLINNACSGQTIDEILNSQFADEDSGDFKAFGQPQFATISAAGDDIEFKELVLSCIYEFPYKPRPCQEQISRSKGLLNAPDFVSSIQNLVQTTMNKGLTNHKDFRIYYLGYAQFFNTGETNPDFCSQKTWSLCGNNWFSDCEKLELNITLRTQLNELATILNSQIQKAVDSFKDSNKDDKGQPLVKYVDIDEIVQGHRYCEQGKEEPVENDDDIWLFQWADDETTNRDGKHEFYNQVAKRFSDTPDIQTLQNETLSGTFTISVEDFLQAEIDVANANPTLANSIDAEGAITNRVKTFHPKIQYHALIEQKLRDLITADYSLDATATPPECDFSAGSCNSFQNSCPAGNTATCVEDHGTGGGICQCLTPIQPPV